MLAFGGEGGRGGRVRPGGSSELVGGKGIGIAESFFFAACTASGIGSWCGSSGIDNPGGENDVSFTRAIECDCATGDGGGEEATVVMRGWWDDPECYTMTTSKVAKGP